MPAPLVIFDCDGVLVDSEIIACQIEADELTRIGYPISVEEDILRFAGKSQKTIMETVGRALGHPVPDGFEASLHEKIIKALSAQLQAMPGMARALSCITHKCVASSGAPDKIANSLRVTGLSPYFQPEHLFSALSVKAGKPAPDLFLYAAHHMGYPPTDCVVIEDSIYGVQAGKSAGMHVLGFIGGSHVLEKSKTESLLRQSGADCVFDNMELLPDLLKKVLRE